MSVGRTSSCGLYGWLCNVWRVQNSIVRVLNIADVLPLVEFAESVLGFDSPLLSVKYSVNGDNLILVRTKSVTYLMMSLFPPALNGLAFFSL